MRLGGRYRLESRLARGGMADVWVALDELLDRTVAVKVLAARLAVDDAYRQRFREEARTAGQLAHPGIAAIYDFGEGVPQRPAGHPGGESEAVLYLVMELVPGHSLADILLDGALGIDLTLDLLIQTARALDVAHRFGVVHRDVKPANLMVTPQQQIKVTDFGISRRNGYEPLTATGKLVGTPDYLAPELSRGQAATPLSDVYALGVVAYECLSGRRPFSGANQVAVMTAHVEQAPPPLPQTVSRELAAAVMRALEKDPQRRFLSAGEFADALQRIRAARTAVYRPLRADAPVRAAAGVASGSGSVAGRRAGGGSPAAATSLLAGPARSGRPSTGDMPPDPWRSGRLALDVNDDDVPDDELLDDAPRSHGGRNLLLLATVLLLAAGAFTGFRMMSGTTLAAARTTPTAPAATRSPAPVRPSPSVVTVPASNPGDGGGRATDPNATNNGTGNGGQQVKVPELTGAKQSNARRELQERNLQVADQVVPVDSPTVRKGRVVRTDPPPGSQVTVGSQIVLYVSTGQVTVPDVTNQPVGAAQTTLQNLNLRVAVVFQQAQAPLGTVLAQDVTGSFQQGGLVTLTVSGTADQVANQNNGFGGNGGNGNLILP